MIGRLERPVPRFILPCLACVKHLPLKYCLLSSCIYKPGQSRLIVSRDFTSTRCGLPIICYLRCRGTAQALLALWSGGESPPRKAPTEWDRQRALRLPHHGRETRQAACRSCKFRLSSKLHHLMKRHRAASDQNRRAPYDTQRTTYHMRHDVQRRGFERRPADQRRPHPISIWRPTDPPSLCYHRPWRLAIIPPCPADDHS